MPKRKRKAFNRPRRLYDSLRIKEEDALVKKYGLKNKREVWRAEFAIGKIRRTAKKLITAPEEKREKFVERQKAKGFQVENFSDVLSLAKEDYLKRRLQSIVVKKELARTPKQARQFIAHKHITISGNIINSPSHLTTAEEEANVKLKLSLAVKKEAKQEEKPGEECSKKEGEEMKQHGK